MSLRQNYVPIQRLIISLNSSLSSGSSNSVAHTLIRNCNVPPTDIQIGNDHTLGFSSSIAVNKRGREIAKGVSKRRQRQDRAMFSVDCEQSRRMLDRPMFEDFGCDLYCDRLMLGEPPIRTALICPFLPTTKPNQQQEDVDGGGDGNGNDFFSGQLTFESICKVLQQLQSLQPEDILVVLEENELENQKQGEERKRNENDKYFYYIGPIPEKQVVSNAALSQVVQAIQWRFGKQEEKVVDDENDHDDDDDDDPIQYVSCLFGSNDAERKIVGDDNNSAQSSSSSLRIDKGDDEEEKADRIRIASNTKALLAGMWSSHPDAAAIAAKIINDEMNSNDSKRTKNIDLSSRRSRNEETSSDNSAVDVIKQFTGSSSDSSGETEKYYSPLFQFSMIRQRHERILEAAHHPHLVRGLVPGVAPTSVRELSDKIGERVRAKMQKDEKTRQIGKGLIEELLLLR